MAALLLLGGVGVSAEGWWSLQPLAKAAQKDIQGFIRMAETGQREGIELQGNYSANEQEEILTVLEKLVILRDVVLKVNQLYIESAGQADEFRTEPAFKMQGSYRNMNRLAEKVLPMMNEQELMDLVLDHYKGESQTLTTGAEANFLKFKQLIGVMNEEEESRWEGIKKTFGRNQFLQGGDQNDPVSRVVSQLSLFTGGLESIEGTLKDELSKPRTTTIDIGTMSESIEGLRQTLAEGLANQPAAAVPVESATSPVDTATGENQQILAQRQDAMIEFIQQSNLQLAQAINESQVQAQSSQMQGALQQVGNLFVGYQSRVKELQEQLQQAKPDELVVDINREMAANSDELIQQILEQLDKVQQKQPEEEPPLPPAEEQE